MEWSCEPEILEFLEHGRPVPTLLKILRKQLAYLETQPVAPPHCYLEVIDQRYARWRSHNFVFSSGKKTCYIGKVGSPAYEQAQKMVHNRMLLDMVRKRIAELQ